MDFGDISLTFWETYTLIRSMGTGAYNSYILYTKNIQHSCSGFLAMQGDIFLRFGSETHKYCSCLYSAILRRLWKAPVYKHSDD